MTAWMLLFPMLSTVDGQVPPVYIYRIKTTPCPRGAEAVAGKKGNPEEIVKISLPFRKTMLDLNTMNENLFTPALFVFLGFALPISFIDIRSYRIPDVLSIPCFLLILILHIRDNPGLLPNFLAAAFFSALVFFLIRLATRGLGLGDVKFAALTGLFCGLPWAWAAFLLAAIAGLGAAPFLASRKTKKNPPLIPFAPFLSLGAVAAYGLSRYIPYFF
jgi:prepilin signal peptidase PulO-like enzyme (type II secretory pathway)